ncbi:MAG: MFS transporter, partial [Nanoarchaeota archaeon]
AVRNYEVFMSYVLLFLGFMALGVMYPFFLIVINDCNREKGKTVMIGLRDFTNILGQIIGPILGGFIADILSVQYVLLLVPIFLIIPWIHLRIRKKDIESDFLSLRRKK